jgi:hypothetical protein
MTGMAVLLWVKAHWRESLAVVLLGAVVVGATVAYGSWRLRGAKIERLEVKLETERANSAQLSGMLARCNLSAREWQTAAVTCDEATRQWIMEAERQKLAVKTERERLAAERRARREAEARLADAVTAVECEAAVLQLAEVLR